MCLIRLVGLVLILLGLAVVITLIAGCQPAEPVLPPPPRQGQHDEAPDPKEGCTPPKVLAFCATWCGPCQAAQPKLRWLEKQGVEVIHIDVDQRQDLCKQYGVTSYPTFFVYVCHKDTVKTQDIDEVVKCMYWLKDKGVSYGTSDQTERLP